MLGAGEFWLVAKPGYKTWLKGYFNQKGNSPRVSPFHCTSVWLILVFVRANRLYDPRGTTGDHNLRPVMTIDVFSRYIHTYVLPSTPLRRIFWLRIKRKLKGLRLLVVAARIRFVSSKTMCVAHTPNTAATCPIKKVRWKSLPSALYFKRVNTQYIWH